MTCRKNYWDSCFQQLTTYMYKKKGKKYLEGYRMVFASMRAV